MIWFPKQTLDARALKAFSERFGSLQGSPTGTYCEPDVPEVMILSNIVEDGKPIGLADAGQDWHTDMSYNELVGFTNVLYGIKIPRRDGKPLGNTVFADMHAAYEDLSPALKTKLANATATHDFNKFWEEMRRRPGSTRPALTAGAARGAPAIGASDFPDASDHRPEGSCTPIRAIPCASTNSTKRKATRFCRTYSVTSCSRSTSMPTAGREGDVLMWDHIGTLHNAIPDYRPRRASAHQALPGDGGPDLRSGLRARASRAGGDLIRLAEP